MENLVTIVSFDDVPLALIARSKLEGAGIPCFLANEHLVGLYWLWGPALGGVTLQVRREDAEAAAELLAGDLRPEDLLPEDRELAPDLDAALFAPEAVCPECGGTNIKSYRLNKALLAAGTLLGLPLRFRSRLYRCRDCGRRWKEKKQ